MVLGWLLLAISLGPAVEARVPIGEGGELDVAEVVVRLADASGVAIERPEERLTLPVEGIAGTLTRTLLADCLGESVSLRFDTAELVARIDSKALVAAELPRFRDRLADLAERAGKAAKRRLSFGMHALASYRPNDPTRPTVCLIHGLNSTSGVFVHMVGPLEEAGYGVVVYDFPYNRDLDETSAAFGRDWAEFRRKAGDVAALGDRGALDGRAPGPVVRRGRLDATATTSALILIAPPNHGSSLAKAQTLLQMVQGLQAVNGSRRTDAAGASWATASGRRPTT